MDLTLLVPLGMLGFVRWICWLVRRVPAIWYRPYESGHSEPLTVVTPVYQEDPDVFRAALETWIMNGVDEVICVVDATDSVCVDIASEYRDRGHPVRVIVTDVPGKRPALRIGWELATTPLVALVDSDTLWASDVRERVGEPFADPAIGGVGTRQNVLNPETVWQRVNDMYLDYRYFDENAAQTVVGQAVSCLSGRTAVYRRELLLELGDDFVEESFLGRLCNSGEDKRLTMLALRRGKRTYMQRSARVWSTFPRDGRTFVKQRVRWARNTWRSDLRALLGGWVVRRHPFLAFTMTDKAVSGFTLLAAPVFLGLALARSDWIVVGALASWWMLSRAAKMLPHLRRRPADIVLMPAFVGLSFLMAGIKLYALATIRTQRWLTRDVAVVDGEVRRTGVPA